MVNRACGPLYYFLRNLFRTVKVRLKFSSCFYRLVNGNTGGISNGRITVALSVRSRYVRREGESVFVGRDFKIENGIVVSTHVVNNL